MIKLIFVCSPRTEYLISVNPPPPPLEVLVGPFGPEQRQMMWLCSGYLLEIKTEIEARGVSRSILTHFELIDQSV